MIIYKYHDGAFIAYEGLKLYAFTPKEVHDRMERGDHIDVSLSASMETCQMLEDNIYHAYVDYDAMHILYCGCTVTRGRLSFGSPEVIYKGESVTDIIKYKRLNKLTIGGELS